MFIFTIRKKIWSSFGILITLLISVGLIANNSLQSNKDKLATLVEEVQPAMQQSLKIVNELDRASASLGFYLLSKEEVHKNNYLNYTNQIAESVKILLGMQVVKSDSVTLEMVQGVELELVKLQGYKKSMLGYASDDSKNLPGMAMASNIVNPLAQTVMQNLQQMLQSETNEKVTAERRELLLDIVAFRANFTNSLIELRAFLAFRVPSSQENFKTNTELSARNLLKLNQYNQDMLTFEQQESLDIINKVYKEWFVSANKLFQVHGAEDWRQDAFVIRKELSPLVLKIQDRLNTLVKAQEAATLESSNELTVQVQLTQTTIGGLIIAGLIASLLIGLLLVRSVTKPIDALKNSAYQLASGKLNTAIDISRKDELGSLAKSFAEMRDAIVKTFSDLTRLNHTGEALTSMHEPVKVLEHALAVMSAQTNVEWGSVYLYNTETQQLEVATYHPPRDVTAEHRARTFGLGEGVAGNAARDHQIIYIPDTTQGQPPFELRPGDDATPRALISVPMMDNSEVFGVMNFSGKVGKVTFSKSDREFAETISRMAVVSFKNIKMLHLIEEQNRTLEHKVEERTAQLRQKTNDINNMMQNMHQGIFTILPGDKIHPEYSIYLESIVETKDIANRDVMELLFSDSTLGVNALSQISAAFFAILDEDEMMFDFNRHCLVSEFTKKMPDGRVKIMELDWDPITDSGNVVKLMVTLRDVTALRGLQAEADHQKWELDVIGQILSVSSDKFLSFIRDASRFINENAQLITQNSHPVSDVIATLFRNMHTIKGNARIYSFTAITDVAHAAEETYNEMRKPDAASWDKDKMLAELETVRGMLHTYESVYTEKLAGNTTPGLFVEQALLDKLTQTLDSCDNQDANSLILALKHIKSITGAMGTESMASILDAITHALPEMAQLLGKAAPQVVINDHNIRFVPDIAPVIKNILTHSFRNAMDHGLETSAERKLQGKSDWGTISVEVKLDGEQVVLMVSDDGRGLAVNKLKQKAIQSGSLNAQEDLSEHELSELIFKSGLTTADKVSDISGRGVGMDAIRKFVEKAGGKVDIHFKQKPKQDSEYLPFALNISLPSSCAKQMV